MISYGNIEQIVSTTHDTVNKLLEFKNGPDALALYFRYIQQKKMQENINTLSSVRFMKKALGRGSDRFYKAKKILEDVGLIENVASRDDCGKILSHRVKVNFITRITVPELDTSVSETGTSVPENQITEKPDSGKQERNTPIENINTLEEKVNTLSYSEKVNSSLKDNEQNNGFPSPAPPQESKSKINLSKTQIDQGKIVYDTIKKYSPAVDGKIDDCYYLRIKIKNMGYDPGLFLDGLIQEMIRTGKSEYYSYANPKKLNNNIGTIISSLNTKNFMKSNTASVADLTNL